MVNRFEINFDGLVGPTHFYGGLSPGNVSSANHKNQISNPKKAALQGLEKMKLLMDLGIKQAIIPPHPRPLFNVLERLGFQKNMDGFNALIDLNPDLASACFSAASMWTANIGTITASVDSADNRIHITPANLMSNFHRSLEIIYSPEILKKIFPKAIHHPTSLMSIPDEGAANVMRLSDLNYDEAIHVFVFGRSVFCRKNKTRQYPCRQSKEAFEIIAHRHHLDQSKVLFIEQNAEAIDQGVFHNDVIATSYQNILIFHEKAFRRSAETIEDIKACYSDVCGIPLQCIEIHESDIFVGEAVSTYLFNSQIVRSPNQGLVMIAPNECQDHVQARVVIEKNILSNTEINKVYYVDVSQSMRNGGGPACLRWRAVVDESELSAILPTVILNDKKYEELVNWVKLNYVEELTLETLIDPKFLEHNEKILKDLYALLNIDIL